MDIIGMEMELTTVAGALVVGLLLGGSLVAIVYQILSRAKSKTLEQDLQRQISAANREAENIIK